MKKLGEYLKMFENQPVAVFCMRYCYRGRLTEIGDGFIVLSEVHAVEQTGPASGAKATLEDPIPSDVIIKTDVIEIVCQPAWCWDGFKK